MKELIFQSDTDDSGETGAIAGEFAHFVASAGEISATKEHSVERLLGLLEGYDQNLAEAIRGALSDVRKTHKGNVKRLASQGHNIVRRLPQRGSLPSENLPIDSDNKSALVRVETPPLLDREPVFGKTVWRALDQIVGERTNTQSLEKMGLRPGATAIFTGPPGVGKTLAARWVASQLGLPIVILDLATVVSSLLGKTGGNIKSAFEYAKSYPCVFFLDEFDAVAKRRNDDRDVGELKRLVAVILQEVDLWSPQNLLIAATNHSELLDPALWRRFDYRVSFPKPDTVQLKKLLKDEFEHHGVFPSAWYDILPCIMLGQSQHDLIREASRLLRIRIVQGDDPANEELAALGNSLISQNDREARLQLAKRLISECRMSQRRASDLTGISRDAIRKVMKE